MVLNYDVNGDGRQIAVELYGTLHFDGGDASGAPQVPSFAFHSSLQACQALALGRYPLHFLCTCLCELISPAALSTRVVRFGKVHLRFFHPLSTSSSRKGSGNQVIITSRCTSNQPHGFEIVGWFTRLTLTPLFPQNIDDVCQTTNFPNLTLVSSPSFCNLFKNKAV